jgi:hypothetical protein
VDTTKVANELWAAIRAISATDAADRAAAIEAGLESARQLEALGKFVDLLEGLDIAGKLVELYFFSEPEVGGYASGCVEMAWPNELPPSLRPDDARAVDTDGDGQRDTEAAAAPATYDDGYSTQLAQDTYQPAADELPAPATHDDGYSKPDGTREVDTDGDGQPDTTEAATNNGPTTPAADGTREVDTDGDGQPDTTEAATNNGPTTQLSDEPDAYPTNQAAADEPDAYPTNQAAADEPDAYPTNQAAADEPDAYPTSEAAEEEPASDEG